MESHNERVAEEKLKRRGFRKISLEDKTDSLELKILTFLNKIKSKDLVAFSRQFAVMISANLPLVQSLRVVAEQNKNISLKIVLSHISQEVDGGARLSDALAKRPHIFSNFYVSIVRSGETSGKLDEVLTYLADEMERNYDMTSKIKGAMIYPVIVFLGLIGIGIFMMIFIVPRITEVLLQTGAELPLATRMVIGISDFLTVFWWVLLLILLGLVFSFRSAKKTSLGQFYLDSIKLKLPVFGKMYKYIYITHFSRSMATLISGGVQVTTSLGVVKGIINNKIYQDLIEEAEKRIREGSTISSVFMKSDDVPKMVSQMISVGEKTGKLDMVLDRVSKFYERELYNITNNLMVLLEPFIVIVMGVGVGVVMAAIILPMYNVAQHF